MKQLRAVDEYDEVRRAYARLGHVVYLQPAASVRRRLHARRRVGEDVVEHAGRDAGRALVVDVFYELEEPVDALTRHRGDEDDGRVAHEGEVAHDVLAHLNLPSVTFFSIIKEKAPRQSRDFPYSIFLQL